MANRQDKGNGQGQTEALTGVNITLLNSRFGTITDDMGNYVFGIPKPWSTAVWNWRIRAKDFLQQSCIFIKKSPNIGIEQTRKQKCYDPFTRSWKIL